MGIPALDVNGGIVCSPNTAGKDTFELSTNAVNEGRLRIKNVDATTVQIRAGGDSYFNGGNVGIGTASPTAPLHVEGATSGVNLLVDDSSGYGVYVSTQNTLNFNYGRDATTTGYINFCGYEAAYTQFRNLNISNGKQGTVAFFDGVNSRVGIGTTSTTAKLHVKEAANNTESDAHVRIEGNGYSAYHFLDGTAYYIGQNSGSRELRIYSQAETAGVTLAAAGTSWGTFSDERLKENIQDIGSVTDKIKDIRCVSFNRTDIEDSKETIGFIAQDFVGKFDQVLDKSKLKDDEEEEYYSIKYTETIPVLLKAIQEQQTIIDDLKSRIETLEG
jgi:hypothetical protein